MALQVPKEPKIYTTKYDNFRGVDFTNDPSNVWSHRSPNAKNMTPDLSGRPWKRTGWKVEKSSQDFRDCFNTQMGYEEGDPGYYDGPIVPIKTSYFELGGMDYLAISNNLGLFFYSSYIGSLASNEPYLIYIDRYYGEIGTPSESTATQIAIAPDANRGFFFEGQGKAGFYIFCTTTDVTDPDDPVIETSLFRFDGEKLRKVDPRVPIIMIGKEPGDTAGTIYEYPNILTLKRICQFMGNGSTAEFVLPEKADSTATLTVEVLVSGVWTTRQLTTHYTVDYSYSYAGQTVTKVTFTAGNIPVASDIDNVRVTYSIGGSIATLSKVPLTPKNIVRTSVMMQQRTVTYVNGTLTSTTPWANKNVQNSSAPATWAIPNVVISSGKPDIDVYMQTAENTWTGTPILSSIVDAQYMAYSNILTVDVTQMSGFYANVSQEASNPTQVSTNVTKVSRDASGEVHAMGPGGKITDTITTIVEQRYLTTYYRYPIKVEANQRTYSSSPERAAFEQCSRAMVFGDGLINSVFMTGSSVDDYKSRVWWSYATDPSYFPDVYYFEAGSNDTKIAGLMKVGEFLGVIKQGQSFDSTIYLAYHTKVASGTITNADGSTETIYDDTYAVKSSIGGIGAVSNGAFNILNDEPLFLSRNGVMGINPANENEKQLRNRSFYVNKKLLEEGSLENAFSFVYRNMYILAVNNHCYVLDGSQKSSWANEKTNLQYECYYWDNVPAQCFARFDEQLYFTDHKGRLCRFKPEGIASSYHDDYDPTIVVADDASRDVIPVSVLCSNPNVKVQIDTDEFWAQASETGQYVFTLGSAGYLHRTLFGHDLGNSGHLDVNSSPRTGDSITEYLHDSEGWHINGEPTSLADYGIVITEGTPQLNDAIVVMAGNPIVARWTTVLDDDGSAHYFKNLQKKGTMVALFPDSSTGVKVYLKKDNEAELYIGRATVRGSANEITAPSDFYLKKKAKKYKRLQIIAESDGFDENFGIDEFIKCYTVGSYSRNR